jgi:hypothetical protein
MLTSVIGERAACAIVHASRATMQRRRKPVKPIAGTSPARRSHRRLSDNC